MRPFRRFYHFGPSVSVPAYGGSVRVRIGETAQKSVVFFGVPSPDGIQYGGTGFLAAVSEGEFDFGYLVTCRHVARGLEGYSDTGFYLRLNIKGGGSHPEKVEDIKWTYHPDPSVDLAAAHFQLNTNCFDHTFFKFEASYADHRKPGAAVTGDVINLVGLFRLHAGSHRNVPIVHTGHIAMLPNPAEKVPIRDRITKQLVLSEMYLIEAQTLDGLSGSPVFIHDMVGLAAFPPVNKDGVLVKAYGDVLFLGIYCGSWDGEPGAILAKDRNLVDHRIRVPVGMGLVAPAHQLLELLGDEELKLQRKNSAARIIEKRAATTDAAFPDPAPKDENPQHREDFTSLLGKAARTLPQDD
jgi:hypothetical protein